MKLLTTVVLTLLLLLSLSIPAMAQTAPTQERFSVAVDFLVLNCGDFEIHDALTVDVHRIIFTDSTGTAVEEISQGAGTDHLYNTSDPGKSIDGIFRETRKINLLTGEVIINGPSWLITAPSHGPVYFLTGHNIYNSTFDHILQRGANRFDDELLCSLLR